MRHTGTLQRPIGGPPDDIYAANHWDCIRRVIGQLGLNADELMINRSAASGDPYQALLRSQLNGIANLYHVRRRIQPKLKLAKIIEGLQLARLRTTEALAAVHDINYSFALWNQNDQFVDQHSDFDTIMLKLGEVNRDIDKQVDAYKSYDQSQQNAANAAKEAFYKELCELWDSIMADRQLKDSLKVRFLVAAAAPVLGGNVATAAAIRARLRRLSEVE